MSQDHGFSFSVLGKVEGIRWVHHFDRSHVDTTSKVNNHIETAVCF